MRKLGEVLASSALQFCESFMKRVLFHLSVLDAVEEMDLTKEIFE